MSERSASPRLYGRFQLWDVLNPLLLGAAGLLGLSWLVKQAGQRERPLRLVLVAPLALAGADLLENGMAAMGWILAAATEPSR